MEFKSFGKIGRMSRKCTITEKIDGTNACVGIEALPPVNPSQGIGPLLDLHPEAVGFIYQDDKMYAVYAGSRERWLSVGDDNYGFAQWVEDNIEQLIKLGEGRHYGEWWGQGVRKGHGNVKTTFSLFNTKRWSDPEVRPACCSVVPVLYEGFFSSEVVDRILGELARKGSKANPGMMNPEGVIIFHHALNDYMKKTLTKDESPKNAVLSEEPSELSA